MIKTIRYSLQYSLQEWECTDDKNNQVHSSIGLQEWECTDDKNNQVQEWERTPV